LLQNSSNTEPYYVPGEEEPLNEINKQPRIIGTKVEQAQGIFEDSMV
jgi:hypothetical protein